MTNDNQPAPTQAATAAEAAQSPIAPPARPERRINLGWWLAFRSHSGQARGFLRFWPVWQWLSHIVQRHHAIPDAPANLFEIQFTRFHGRPIELPDGTRVAGGDRIAVVHVNNRMIAGPAGHLTPWQQLRMMRGDLHALATWAASPTFPPNVRALYGYTLLSRSAPRLGFTVRRRPSTWWNRLNGFFLTGLIVLYNPGGRDRLTHGATYGSEPHETWMSLGELQRRYSSDQSGNGE
jgi:hypothetical protein